MRRIVVPVLMVAVVGLLFVAGVHNLRKRRAAIQLAEANHVNLTPASAAGSESSSDGMGTSLIGKVAPNFTLTSLDGKKVSLADYKGKPVVVNFWATYCGPCKLEMPWFQEFSQKYQAQGLTVLGLDDEDGVTKDDVQKAAKKIGVSYPILIANDKVGSAFGLGDYLPVTYYVNAKGVVVEQTPGAPSKDEVEANVRKAIGVGGE